MVVFLGNVLLSAIVDSDVILYRTVCGAVDFAVQTVSDAVVVSVRFFEVVVESVAVYFVVVESVAVLSLCGKGCGFI